MRKIKFGDEPRTMAVSPEGRKVNVVTQRSQTFSAVDIAAAQHGRRRSSRGDSPGRTAGVRDFI
jgi:DNA-binding beta-propeller fold protein YncE